MQLKIKTKIYNLTNKRYHQITFTFMVELIRRFVVSVAGWEEVFGIQNTSDPETKYDPEKHCADVKNPGVIAFYRFYGFVCPQLFLF